MNNLRKKIEKELGRKMPDFVWLILKTENLPDVEYFLRHGKAAERKEAFFDLLNKAHFYCKKWDSEEKKQPDVRLPEYKEMPAEEEIASAKEKVAPPPNKRFQALTDIVATLANKDNEIISFRQEILGGKLLKPEEVPRWVRATGEKEGHTLKITLNIESKANLQKEIIKQAQAASAAISAIISGDKPPGYPVTIGLGGSKLSYIGPDSFQEVIPINENGILGRLKKLAKKYEAFWSEAQAVHFILTGKARPVSPGKVGFKLNSYGMHKVKLEVSPHLTGDNVRSLYIKGRQKLFQVLKTDRNSRRISEKHIQLAVFAVKENGSWVYKMKKWNVKNPQWKYNNSSNFARDCKTAYRRVTGWKWEE